MITYGPNVERCVTNGKPSKAIITAQFTLNYSRKFREEMG